MKGTFTKSLFDDEPAGTFTEGHVFVNAPDISGADRDPCLGYWRCDISHHDELTWSGEVYALFGLPDETPVTREWAVQRYSEQSRRALEHVRTYALKRKLGFILDVEIFPEGGASRWIRILALPVLAKRDGRVVGLEGLKRLL